MKFKILVLLLLGFYLNGYSQQDFQTTIYYKTGESNLSSNDKKEIDGLLQNVPAKQEYYLMIKAYTDSVGSFQNNLNLSEARGKEIVSYLRTNNIPLENIQMQFYGEKRKLRSSSLIIPKMDRMASLELMIPEKVMEKAQVIWSSYEGPRISNFYKKSKIDGDEFLINTDADTLIRCSGGTVIQISKNTFEQNGKSLRNQTVIINVREVFKKSEMILENLTTQSGGRLLETGGMLHITASLNGKEVKIQLDKPITIFMPSKKNPKEFQLFDGHRNPKDSSMDWRLTDSNLRSQRMLNLYNCWSEISWEERPGNCPFFFCKVQKFFNNLFKSNSASQGRGDGPLGCNYLKELLRDLGITDFSGTMDEVLKPLYEKFQVNNIQELDLAIQKEQKLKIELQIKNQTVSFEDYQYFIFKRQQLGWINCDAFGDVPADQLTNLKVFLQPSRYNDVKLVFKQRNSILRSNSSGPYGFTNIPRDEVAYVVAMKEANGKIYLFMEEINTSVKSVKVEWEELSFEALQAKLAILDS